jgi:hypothetical protein
VRWAQSASCDQRDAFGSAAEWPESEYPEAKATAIANAGHKSDGRSVSQEKKISAITDGSAHDRPQIAVEERRERELQHGIGAQEEGCERDLHDTDRSGQRDEIEATLEYRRHRPAQQEQPEAETADDECERGKGEPASGVLGAGGARGTGGSRDFGRLCAHTEREDSGDDVAVAPESTPAHGVAATVEPWHLGSHGHPIPGEPQRAGQRPPPCVEQDQPAGNEPDALVELDPHGFGRDVESLLVRGGARLEDRVRRPGGGQQERDNGDYECRSGHRRATPASGERWPKTGATSRSA